MSVSAQHVAYTFAALQTCWQTWPVTAGEELPDEPGVENEGEDSAGEEQPAKRGPGPRFSMPSLDAFAAIQRHIAFIDFPAINAAQRLFDQSGIAKALEAQDAIAKHFARSVDFARLTETHRRILDSGLVGHAQAAQRQWAESLARSIDFTALNNAVAASAALDSYTRTSEAFNESLRKQTEYLARIADQVTFSLPTVDLSGLLEALDRWIPVNLREVTDLDVVATITLEEGLPLTWVPRTEIVVLLAEADSSDARIGILSAHRAEILDDCEKALLPISHEWARECRNAIAAMRADLDGPAQSHASNIIDSIVLRLHGSNGRSHVRQSAQEDFDDQPLQLAAENLTLRPLFRAFTTWYPNTGIDPPDYFARHATAHAVGHAGVFAPISALVAVMLATSLTVQYGADDQSIEASGSDEVA